MQVVALPPVDLVVSGQVKATDIPPTNEKVDVWALGVTIFELVTGGSAGRVLSRGRAQDALIIPRRLPQLLGTTFNPSLHPIPAPLPCAGRLPFEGKDKPEIKRNITANNLAAMPAFLTPQCQSFIRAMLTYSPDQRPSCAKLLQHPYIAMHCAQAPGKPAAAPTRTVSLHAYSLGAGEGPGRGAVHRQPATVGYAMPTKLRLVACVCWRSSTSDRGERLPGCAARGGERRQQRGAGP